MATEPTTFEEYLALLARSVADAAGGNTLQLGFEDRLIVIAQGKEFHNDEMTEELRVPDVLLTLPLPDSSLRALRAKRSVPLMRQGDGSFVLFSAEQGVRFTLKVVTTKALFEGFLNTGGTHLIYSGHARYGRGPCFGRGKAPSEEWEEGVSGDTGIFRMGYPFLSVPAIEVVEHGYTANVVESDVSIQAADCDPDLRPHIGQLRARTAEEIRSRWTEVRPALQRRQTPERVAILNAPLRIRNETAEKTYWTYMAYEYGVRQPFLVLHAGWRNTLSRPHEIGAHEPTCRVLCHFGCSTKSHNYRVVRHLRGWRREGNERYAYWTTNLSDGRETVYWLYHILTYPRPNAFQSWEASIQYAQRKTNQDLASDGAGYQIY